jgi:hypothetical protein
MRRRIAWATAWLAGAVIVAVVVAVTVSLLGTDLFGASSPVLSQAEVRQRLNAANAAPSAATQPAPGGQTSGPGNDGGQHHAKVTQPFSYSGGNSVRATCQGTAASLMYVVGLGFEVDGASTGPGASAWVRFKSGQSEQTVTITCPGGQPHSTVSTGDNDIGDDHGGGGGGGPGPGGGGGGHGGGG